MPVKAKWIGLAAIFVAATIPWVVGAAEVEDTGTPTHAGCTVFRYAHGHDGPGYNPFAYSDTQDVNSCATLLGAKAQWCENYYCEHDGWNYSLHTAADALAEGGGPGDLDLVRGWGEWCVDGYPYFNCGYHDFGDLPLP